MANSRHAHLRYNIMDNCFRSKQYSFEELLRFVNDGIEELYPGDSISTRTLREDLKVFRNKDNGFDAPLPENIRILKYTDPNFSIAQRPLLEFEQYLIDAAQQLLSRFENHPKYDKLAEALIKFQDEEEQEIDDAKILFYDHNDEYKGIKYLKPLYLAIKKKQVLEVTYKNFQAEEPIVFEFHPYILKQYNRRWFVYGFNVTSGVKEWSIPLDERLINFEELDDELEYIESETNWADFFRSMVGIVKQPDSQIERIVLKFYNDRIDHFKTKPFHPDYEEFFEDEKKDMVWFECILNRELTQQILSYGQDVEVLEPQTLRERMREHANSMQNHYKE